LFEGLLASGLWNQHPLTNRLTMRFGQNGSGCTKCRIIEHVLGVI
jgi:hypothetical protein